MFWTISGAGTTGTGSGEGEGPALGMPPPPASIGTEPSTADSKSNLLIPLVLMLAARAKAISSWMDLFVLNLLLLAWYGVDSRFGCGVKVESSQSVKLIKSSSSSSNVSL